MQPVAATTPRPARTQGRRWLFLFFLIFAAFWASLITLFVTGSSWFVAPTSIFEVLAPLYGFLYLRVSVGTA